MQMNEPEKDRSLDEKLTDLILLTFPMPKADPKKKLPLVGLYMTDPAHPVVRKLYEEFKRERGIPMSCAMSDRERILFDVSILDRKAKAELYHWCKAQIEAANEATSE